MNDAQSTIVGLKAQDCPGGGWTGQPESIERATVADCLTHGVCGCIYGGAAQHIERLRAALGEAATYMAVCPPPAEASLELRAALQARRERVQMAALEQPESGEPK